jgi:hypothetical protein
LRSTTACQPMIHRRSEQSNPFMRLRPTSRKITPRRSLPARRLKIEALEPRALLTYSYPFGAAPQDTGEYMLGDVAVNVVLMESDPAIAPHDNGAITSINAKTGQPQSIQYTAEDWTATSINNAKKKVQDAIDWWQDTFEHMFPQAPSDSLNFHINFKYAETPVHTGYEPIARTSDDLLGDSSVNGPGRGWLYDFLHAVGFDNAGSFSADMRAFNDATRKEADADWAFTIFVVNNANDSDKAFAAGGSFRQAFSFPGGQFAVIPASRPVSTFAHEIGHQFWALDEYEDGDTYSQKRGYYNTPNLNAEDNPAPGFVQAPTIMSSDHPSQNPPTSAQSTSFNTHSLDPYTMGMIGWQDSDHDGIMDVLDVPFTLSGTGYYDLVQGKYLFRGTTHVNALPNQNSSGNQNDISTNQIAQIQAKIDDLPWTQVKTYSERTYSADVSIDLELAQGQHTVQFRSLDSTGHVQSNVFLGTTETPTTNILGGLAGVIYLDQNSNARWDNGEPLQAGVALDLADNSDRPLALQHIIDPDSYPLGWILDNADNTARLSALKGNTAGGDVVASASSGLPDAAKVFASLDSSSNPVPTWNQQRKLRVDFNSPVSTVTIKAYSASPSLPGYARLDAYNANNQLIGRFTSDSLSGGNPASLNVARAAADIKYVLAYGKDSDVVLDALVWGPPASAISDASAGFSLSYLPDGAYRIHLVPPPGFHMTSPDDGLATFTVSGGATANTLNFGVVADTVPAYKFHNYANQFNVNPATDDQITPQDALIIINYINNHPSGDGTIPLSSDPAVIGYLDVVVDGICAAIDALAIINYINDHPAAQGEFAAQENLLANSTSDQAILAEGEAVAPLTSLRPKRRLST